MSSHCLLASISFDEISDSNLIGETLVYDESLLSCFFQVSLSYAFDSLTMIYLGVDLIECIECSFSY